LRGNLLAGMENLGNWSVSGDCWLFGGEEYDGNGPGWSLGCGCGSGSGWSWCGTSVDWGFDCGFPLSFWCVLCSRCEMISCQILSTLRCLSWFGESWRVGEGSLVSSIFGSSGRTERSSDAEVRVARVLGRGGALGCSKPSVVSETSPRTGGLRPEVRGGCGGC